MNTNSTKLMVQLHTNLNLGHNATCKILWQHLDDSLVEPKTYDAFEKALKQFNDQSYIEASMLFNKKHQLFVVGSKNGFIGMFSNVGKGLMRWNFWFNIDKQWNQIQPIFLRWLYALVEDLPVLFASACSVDEYEAKHQIVQTTDNSSNIKIRGSIGDKTSDFYHYLPGIYWLTIFGSDLVSGLGRTKLLNTPLAIVEEITAEQIALRLDIPITGSNVGDMLALEKKIGEYLGSKYFFDREQSQSETVQVPQLLEKLESLEDR